MPCRAPTQTRARALDETCCAPETFRIAFSKDQIADLHRRIDATIWPEIPYETGWTTGTSDRVLRELVRYWRRDYDWFKTQERLNKLPHHRLAIEGEEIHIVWYRGSATEQPELWAADVFAFFSSL